MGIMAGEAPPAGVQATTAGGSPSAAATPLVGSLARAGGGRPRPSASLSPPLIHPGESIAEVGRASPMCRVPDG